ncbi:MAG: hypothetical protein FJ102_03810 [Deltaproteobacteria bacterium]|nr:hypothetical protein [Deltaproteobacteria bacterium]
MLLLLIGCPGPFATGDFVVTENEAGGLDITRYDGKPLVSDLRLAVGSGDEVIEMQGGSYRVASGESEYVSLAPDNQRGEGFALYDLVNDRGDVCATLRVSATGSRVLLVEVAGTGGNRVRFDAACTGDDHFVGGGEHAFDVDHAGESFALWVGEPGIGKVDTESPPDDWFITGTRHASSYPDPFFIRPEPVGVMALTDARVDVDLCTADRWHLDTWERSAAFLVHDADTPMELVQAHALLSGTPAMPPDWAFAPWADAVRGVARVEEVAASLRSAGAPVSVIWSEDWRGGEERANGYHPVPEWEVDETLYPDPSGIDAALEAQGFKWFGYFAPFLAEDTAAYEEASDFVVKTASGEPYLFTGATLDMTGALDLSSRDGWDWALSKLEAAADIGFDGWMADYAEWLPPDGVAEGMDVMADHNAYPLLWQSLHAEALDGRDATFFARSGWSGSPTFAPVHWPGDQRTSFDTDDGFPTIIPMTLGGAIAGVPLSGSDIAGYQSIGNDPSDKELWMRWCTLGAMSPVMRTHHGAYSDENWQFDSDEETLATFALWGQVHAQLFPYLRGLAAEAESQGTPLVRPLFLHYPGEDWGRIDAWLLGPSLLVAPVLEKGALSRQVDLPADTTWYDYWTGDKVQSGTFSAAWDEIPVFAPEGAIVPRFAGPVDTLVDGPLDGLVTLSDADTARVIRVFAGAKGSFVEADGTTYSTDGQADSSAVATDTLDSGSISAGGLKLSISGAVARTYTVEVIAP